MLSAKEKIAYGLGDTASNIIFQTVMMFLLLFYTDIVGLSPSFVGTMFLIVRCIDAITDPLMGALADRTQTRWGQFRPYLLWTALPFAIVSVLTFSTPELSATHKMIYAFITYTLLMIAYTVINIPYCALGGALSKHATERVTIQSYRFVFAMLGGLIVAAGTMPMVAWFGNGDAGKGYQLTMLTMSSLGFIMFIACFLYTKERVSPPLSQSMSFSLNLKSLWQNDQWRILCITVFFLLTGLVVRMTLAVYYVKYVLEREDLITTFMTIGVIASMLGCALAQPLAKRICKIKAYIGIQLLAGCICTVHFFIDHNQIVLAFFLFSAWKLVLDMGTPLLWAKMADTIDYGHKKTGIRITGLVYSGVIFFIKLGVALGGALAGWLLAYANYQPDVSQTEATKQSILLSFTLFPALASFIAAGVMTKYTLTAKKIRSIQSELKISTG